MEPPARPICAPTPCQQSLPCYSFFGAAEALSIDEYLMYDFQCFFNIGCHCLAGKKRDSDEGHKAEGMRWNPQPVQFTPQRRVTNTCYDCIFDIDVSFNMLPSVMCVVLIF